MIVPVPIYVQKYKHTFMQERFVLKRKGRRHNREVTTHISIYTLHLDGLRELYRHFLRLDDGAIVEVSHLH